MYLSGWVSSDLFNPFGIVMFCDNKHLKKQCQYYLSAKNSTFDFCFISVFGFSILLLPDSGKP